MEARLNTRVRGSLGGIKAAAGDLERFSAENHLDASAVWPFQVSLDEMLSNTVRCGYGDAPGEHEIEVRFHLSDGLLEVVLIDDGAPFNPLEAKEPDTTQPLEERAGGGLGIFLVRRLMDEVRYERLEGRNVLTLRKRVET